jgi:hypothetical protein
MTGERVEVDVEVQAASKPLGKRHGSGLCAGDTGEALGRARDLLGE